MEMIFGGGLLPHLGASIFYFHSIIYNTFSMINGVAWSLEVEIQFYLLMPAIAYILFKIENSLVRHIIIFVLALIIVFLLNPEW